VKRIIIAALVCILLLQVPVRADINYNLIFNWQIQPPNVQQNLVLQNTSIHVVDTLPWESPDLAQTWAYTTMDVIPGTAYVRSVDIYIKTGYESTLTHEVGHVLSNAGHTVYWWCFRPEFIQIFQEERYNNVMMAQGFDNILEYVSCAYDMYIRFPDLLKKTNPKTFNYLTVVMRYT